MARTPTVYRSDDAGAPDLDAIMPTTDDKNKLLFHTILKACLVDGYGSKAAAGWTMPHDEITADGCRFVLTNAANSGSLLFEGGYFSGGATDLRNSTLWACSSVPSMDTPVNAWSFLTKYEDRNSASGDVFHNTGLYLGYLADTWVVIANENTAIVIVGQAAIDFSLTSASNVGKYYSAAFTFGVMHDGGDVYNPDVNNFYMAGGDSGSYASFVQHIGFQSDIFTSLVDIIGLSKSVAHAYSYKAANTENTYSPLSAWLPVPIIYNQYGSSAPDGDASTRMHFAAALTGFRKLLLRPYDTSTLNDFMTDNGFEYGKSFNYQGADWVVFKSYDNVLNVVSLAAAEWGA